MISPITFQQAPECGISRFDNNLQGFYGFSTLFSSHTGVAICSIPFVPFHGATLHGSKPGNLRLRQFTEVQSDLQDSTMIG